MNVYTVPRMTRNIDIVIHLKLNDIDTFSDLFNDGFYLYKEGIKSEIQRQGMFNVIDYKSGEKIDFIIRKKQNFIFMNLSEEDERKYLVLKLGLFLLKI